MTLRNHIHFKPIKLSLFEVRNVWKNYETRAKQQIIKNDPNYDRKVFAIKKGVLATIREFGNSKNLKNYKKITRQFEIFVKNSKPLSFELFPTQFLAQKNNLLIERVFPRPNSHAFGEIFISKTGENRYQNLFLRILKNKKLKISQKEFQKKLFEARSDFYKIVKDFEKQTKLHLDYNGGNLIVLDYNEKTGKFVFGFIDILTPNNGGSKYV